MAMASFSVKYTLYIVELEAIKESVEEEVLLRRQRTLHTSCKEQEKKNKKLITPIYCE
jgi:hypothetical protein